MEELDIQKMLHTLMELKKVKGVATLARRAKMPQQTLNRLAMGATPDPRLSTLLPLAEFFDVSLDQLVGKQPLTNSFANKNTLVPIIPWDKAPDSKQFISNMKIESWKDWSTALQTDPNRHWYGLKVMQRTLKGAFAEKTVLIVDADLKAMDGDYVIVYNKESHSVTLRQMLDNGVNVKLKSPDDENECILMKKTETICGVVIQANVPISR